MNGVTEEQLIVEYLLRKLKTNMKTINLYGFPWAFMAFEVIPHLRHQVKDFSEEVSSPRILRWLATKNNKAVGVDLFTPSRDLQSGLSQGQIQRATDRPTRKRADFQSGAVDSLVFLLNIDEPTDSY
ncbi:hypothetical protein HAX54_050945 [Datura stramonium]|uniref:Uncharacterized protein n=1 Tax=Datura stramonium TaxID=4076 RepID=A0ABS8SXQ2_DATST|nr:hypothetical protein [Datura stramonium]